MFCSVTPTVQKETQDEKILPFFHFTKSYSQKQEKKKHYMLYAYIWSTGLLKFERLMYSWQIFSHYLKHSFFSQTEYQISLNYFIRNVKMGF